MSSKNTTSALQGGIKKAKDNSTAMVQAKKGVSQIPNTLSTTPTTDKLTSKLPTTLPKKTSATTPSVGLFAGLAKKIKSTGKGALSAAINKITARENNPEYVNEVSEKNRLLQSRLNSKSNK